MIDTDYLYLTWKNPHSMHNYTVGKLSRLKDGYSFEYCDENELAIADGWMGVPAFPEMKKYKSKELFPVFSSRLPYKKRKNIDIILKKYGLQIYDGFELLRASGGRLPIDTYEFVIPRTINNT